MHPHHRGKRPIASRRENLAKEFIRTHGSLKLDQYIHVHIQALKWLTPCYKLRIEVWSLRVADDPGGISIKNTR